MFKRYAGSIVVATAALALSACATFRVYEEPSSEPRSLVQVANYSQSSLEVFAYHSNQCDEQRDVGLLASVPPREQNKVITPRAIATDIQVSLCIDVYNYETDDFICRRGLGVVADAATDYRIEFRPQKGGCGVATLKTLPANYFQN